MAKGFINDETIMEVVKKYVEKICENYKFHKFLFNAFYFYSIKLSLYISFIVVGA